MAVSVLEQLMCNRATGEMTLRMHKERFRLPETSARILFESSVEAPGALLLSDVAPLIQDIQACAEGKAILTGGWGVRCLMGEHSVPRPSSSDVDCIVETQAVLRHLSHRYNLEVVYDWGCWAGFATTPSGSRVRLEINSSDFLPESVEQTITLGDGRLINIRVGTPLTIISGKLARVLRRGPLERDRIDIALLLLRDVDCGLADQLCAQMTLDLRVSNALGQLGLPQSVASSFSPDEISILDARIKSLRQ